MEKSKVYFTNLRAEPGRNLLQKLEKLIKEAGFDQIDFKGKFAAIKIHFGEPGNLSFLRPNYAKVVADMVKERGGKPFLTDCNTLYVGRRKNALDHIESAYENGFSPFSTGCQVLIADGLKGMDQEFVPVPDGEYVKEAKIGKAVMDADIFISLTHFKGHESTGFGGTFKNIGMGCGSRAGKMEMHYGGKPRVFQEKCIGCGRCRKNCAHEAISFTDRHASIDLNKYVGCGRCIGACPVEAIQSIDGEANDILNCKIAEYTAAVVRGRPCFHISLIVDVSPNCDCHAENDFPIVPDVGMLASFDPVALDMACADLVNRQPVMPGSMLTDAGHKHYDDHFVSAHPDTNWRVCLEHAEKLHLGTTEYELIEI